MWWGQGFSSLQSKHDFFLLTALDVVMFCAFANTALYLFLQWKPVCFKSNFVSSEMFFFSGPPKALQNSVGAGCRVFIGPLFACRSLSLHISEVPWESSAGGAGVWRACVQKSVWKCFNLATCFLILLLMSWICSDNHGSSPKSHSPRPAQLSWAH